MPVLRRPAHSPALARSAGASLWEAWTERYADAAPPPLQQLRDRDKQSARLSRQHVALGWCRRGLRRHGATSPRRSLAKSARHAPGVAQAADGRRAASYKSVRDNETPFGAGRVGRGWVSVRCSCRKAGGRTCEWDLSFFSRRGHTRLTPSIRLAYALNSSRMVRSGELYGPMHPWCFLLGLPERGGLVGRSDVVLGYNAVPCRRKRTYSELAALQVIGIGRNSSHMRQETKAHSQLA